MKILLCGYGSIGRRHFANAQVIVPDAEWTIVEPAAAGTPATARMVATLDAAGDGFDVAMICSPTNLHGEQIAALAGRAKAFFVEKPLAHDRASLAVIRRVLGEMPVMVGCNYRFEAGLQRVKELLQGGTLGSALSIRAEFGQYLPSWRPQQDYRKGYAARRETGGGVILDRIHELDYVTWLMGPVAEAKAFSGRLGKLEIETEDTAEIVLRFASGALGSVHVDYLQREYVCGLKIVCDEGSIEWRFKPTMVRVLGSSWETVLDDPTPDVNAMYVAELRYFFGALERGEPMMNGLAEAAATTELALAAQESA